MDLANLANELNDAAIPEVDPSTLPEAKAGRRPPIYPGSYQFTLPLAFDFGKDDDGTRQLIYASFADAFALKVSPGDFQWTGRLYNRPRTMKTGWGANAVEVLTNDLAQLLKTQGFTGGLTTNKAYAESLSKYPGGVFGGDISWRATCSPKKNIWVVDEEVGGMKQIEGKVGCGTTYISDKGYTKKDGTVIHSIPREEDGRWAERFTCSCGAALNVNDDLSKIRSVKK